MVAALEHVGPIRRYMLRGTISNALGRFVTIGCVFVLTPVLLHALGPVQYGLWLLATTLVGYGALFDLGIAPAIVKYVAEFRARSDPASARTLVATGVVLYGTLGLFVALCAPLVGLVVPRALALDPDLRHLASWVLALLSFEVAVKIGGAATSAVLRGYQRYDLVGIQSSCASLIGALSAVLVVRAGGGMTALAASSLLVTIATQSAGYAIVRHIAPELRYGPRGADRGQLRRIARFSATLFIADITYRIETKTDEIIIGIVLAVSAVTPYALVLRLVEGMKAAAEQLAGIFPPLASQLVAVGDLARLRTLYLDGTRLVMALYLVVGLPLVALSGPLLTIWVGAQYRGGMVLVVVLGLAGLVDMANWPASAIMQGLVRHRPLAIASACSALANLALSIALIGPLGLQGVALGTLVPTLVCSLCFITPYVLRVLTLTPRQYCQHILIPIVLPAIPSTIAIWIMRELLVPTTFLALAAIAVTGGLTYLGSYLLLGAGEAERSFCRDIVAKVCQHVTTRWRSA